MNEYPKVEYLPIKEPRSFRVQLDPGRIAEYMTADGLIKLMRACNAALNDYATERNRG